MTLDKRTILEQLSTAADRVAHSRKAYQTAKEQEAEAVDYTKRCYNTYRDMKHNFTRLSNDLMGYDQP